MATSLRASPSRPLYRLAARPWATLQKGARGLPPASPAATVNSQPLCSRSTLLVPVAPLGRLMPSKTPSPRKDL